MDVERKHVVQNEFLVAVQRQRRFPCSRNPYCSVFVGCRMYIHAILALRSPRLSDRIYIYKQVASESAAASDKSRELPIEGVVVAEQADNTSSAAVADGGNECGPQERMCSVVTVANADILSDLAKPAASACSYAVTGGRGGT